MVITGAGSGLGAAMARRFAQEGYRVAVTDLLAERAGQVLDEIVAAGGEGFAQAIDVRLDRDWDALYQRVLTEWGRIDVLVNNAGVAASGRVDQSSLADWEWVIDTNLMGVVRGCHRFLPSMLEQGKGHVVNVASFAGLVPVPAIAAYGTAKAGVVALSEQMRVDLHGSGVGVSVLCPSFVKTRLLETFRGHDPLAAQQARRWMENTPVTAADVAERVIDAVQRKRFLILTHAHSRWAWRMRRWCPERFHRSVVLADARMRRRAAR